MTSVRKLDSPRGEVGEIDTRSPFQSVKAAVSLFGEVAVSRDRYAVKRRSSESVFEKETQLILAQRELKKIKKQVDSAEATKAKALSDLENATEIFQNLITKLANVRESKQSAMEAAEAVKHHGKRFEKTLSLKAIGYEAWKQELEHARKEYTATVTELDSCKQELNKIRQDFDAALEAKMAAFQTAAEAQGSAKLNSERISELSKEIADMKASIEQLNKAQFDFYKTDKEEAQKNLESLKNEYDPKLVQSLDAKLAETSAEIDVLQEKMRKIHASHMDSVRLLTSELKESTKILQDVASEETSLKKLVFSLRTELRQVKKEQDELKEKEQAAEALSANLTGELQESMEAARPELGTVKDLESNMFYVQSVKIQKLQCETENARREAEETSRKAHELKQEAEKSRAVAEEAEKKLELLLKEAKAAKAAEQRAMKEIKLLSDVHGRVSNSKFSGKIKMSSQEFESLRGKVKECEDYVEKKEAAVMAELQAIYTRKNELDRKVEANLKAIEETNAATETALWYTEMADSAKMAIENELKKKKSCQQKQMVADASSQILDHSSRPISLST